MSVIPATGEAEVRRISHASPEWEKLVSRTKYKQKSWGLGSSGRALAQHGKALGLI
jgi:hypothetical protein